MFDTHPRSWGYVYPSQSLVRHWDGAEIRTRSTHTTSRRIAEIASKHTVIKQRWEGRDVCVNERDVVEDRMSVITCSECELEGGRVGACRYPLSFWLQEPIFEAPIVPTQPLINIRLFPSNNCKREGMVFDTHPRSWGYVHPSQSLVRHWDGAEIRTRSTHTTSRRIAEIASKHTVIKQRWEGRASSPA